MALADIDTDGVDVQLRMDDPSFDIRLYLGALPAFKVQELSDILREFGLPTVADEMMVQQESASRRMARRFGL